MSGISLQQKKDPRKKREEQGLKRKIGETSFEKLHVSKKKGDEIYKLLGEILSKERKKGDHIFL
jgi:predicted membrane chloride channel (bestrophin family)